MKKIILYISCLFVICSSSNAIELRFIDNADLTMQKNILKNKTLHSVESLYSYFVNQGYLDVSIIEKFDTLQIRTAKQYALQSICLDSALIFADLIPRQFTHREVTSLIDMVLQTEKDNGYQFVSVSIDSTILNNYEVQLYCSLNKGPQTIIESIKFEGLTKTDHALLHRYIELEDSIATPKLLQEIERDALAIPFVEYVPPLKQEINEGYLTSNLIIPFKEKENLIFEGGGGYVSETELFVWNLSLRFQNIVGAGREVSIVSQKKDINNQLLEIGYKQPLFVFGIGTAQLKVQTRDYRDQFYEFALNSQLRTYYKKKMYFGLEGQFKSVELENENLSYRTTQLAFSISNSNSESSLYKSQKFIYDWKFGFGNRKYNNDTSLVVIAPRSLNESRIEINTKLFILIKYPFISMIDLNFQSFQTDEDIPPFAELYLVGGTNSLRGFKDEQFPSIRNFTFTIEPQYQFESGNMFLFYDGGYIYNRKTSSISSFDESTIYRYGYGGGILLSSNANYLKISFGWNKELTFDTPRISLELKTGL